MARLLWQDWFLGAWLCGLGNCRAGGGAAQGGLLEGLDFAHGWGFRGEKRYAEAQRVKDFFEGEVVWEPPLPFEPKEGTRYTEGSQ